MSWPLLILGLILFVLLIVVHEMGHFIAARRNGIEVEEAGLGFPPRAKVITKKRGTIYSLNWLPLGGFVKLKGEHDADTSKGGFGAASFPAKVKVMLAGVGMNLATAFAIFTILAVIGMPIVVPHQFTVARDTKTNGQEIIIDSVEGPSPAADAGLHPQDQLIAIGRTGQPTTKVNDPDKLSDMIKGLAGQTVDITYMHAGQTITKTVTLRTQKEADAGGTKTGILGISYGANQIALQHSTWSAPIVALGVMWQITVATLQGIATALSQLFVGHFSKAGSQVAGPAGVVVLIKDASGLGIQFILLIVGVISLTLAIMNLLPIPALDGGRLYLMLIYRARRKTLTTEREELINGIGFAVLAVLFVLITVVDFKRILFK